MRIGRPNTPQQFIFSLEKVDPSSSSSEVVSSSSSSSSEVVSSSSSSSSEVVSSSSSSASSSSSSGFSSSSSSQQFLSPGSSSSSLSCGLDPSQLTLEIISGNTANGPGMTLASSVGNKLHFNSIVDYDGLPGQMLIFASTVQVAMVTFNSPYIGTPFVFERKVGETTTLYCANIVSGKVYF